MSHKHGTAGGYVSHQRQGTIPCAECKAAKAEYDREYRARPEVKRKIRLRSRAQGQAIQALVEREWGMYLAEYELALGSPAQKQRKARQAVVDAHKDEYQRIYREVRDELFDKEEAVQ